MNSTKRSNRFRVLAKILPQLSLWLAFLFVPVVLVMALKGARAASSEQIKLTGALNVPRFGHTATPLTNGVYEGRVLIAGGVDAGGNATASAEVYGTTNNTFEVIAHMNVPRAGHKAKMYPGGFVLVSGGDAAATSELFNPFTLTWTAVEPTPIDDLGLVPGPPYSTAVELANTRFLLFGVGGAALYIPETSQIIPLEDSAALHRAGATATVLPGDKKVLAAGGVNSATELMVEAAVFNPAKVVTDQDDYPPFSFVDITGTGFLPGETVSNQIVEVAGPFAGMAFDPWEVTADTNGNFETSWLVFTEDLLNTTLELTARGQTSGLSAQTRFTDAPAFDAQLQGQSFGSSVWVTGGLTNWQELDLIPARVFMTSQTPPVSNQTITVTFDHTKTSGGVSTPGIQNLLNFTPSAGVVMVSGPTLTDSTGDEWAYSFTVHLLNTNGFVEFRARMAAGAHDFSGSSMALGGTPSLGQLQIHKPAPTGGNPDLGVTKSGPALVNAGTIINYTLSYTNATNSVAVGAQITDVLPAIVTFVSCSGGCTILGNTITWDLGDLQRGTHGSVTYQVMVSASAVNGTSFHNDASIACAQDDPNSANDHSSVTTTVTGGCIAPSIAGNPNNATVCSGESVSFSVAANGSSTLVYRWRKNGATLSNGGNISGATSSTLTINPVGNGDVDSYDVIVTNLCGSITSSPASLSLNPAPLITCPGDIVVSSDPALCGTNVNFTATGTGSPPPTITYSQNPGTFFPVGTNTVTATASNGCGTASCNFKVIVMDKQPPVATCPPDISVTNALGLCGSNVVFSVGGTDNCSTVSTNQLAGLASGDLFPVGKTTNTFSVVDASGNSNVCSFTVTVTDTQPPVATCPPDINVTNAAGLCGSNVVFNVGGTDNCGVVSTNQLAGLASGDLFPVGKTTNTFSVVDASGNSNVCSFVVTVTDTEAPAITCPPDISATNALGLCGSNVVYSVGGTDNCGVVSTNLLAGLASGSLFPVGKTTNTFSVVDASGNSNVCSFTVTVTDTEAPVATCPPDISVTNAAGLCGSNVVFSVGGTDNCSTVSTNQLAGLASGDLFPVGKTTNTFSVVDASGNSNVCSFVVTVTDTEAPAITCPPNIYATNALGLCGSNVVYSVGGTDNCGVVSTNLLAGLASGSLFPVGKTTNTFSVVDASGNSNVCSFTVTVTDTEAPVATCPPDISVTNAAGLCGSNVVYSVGGTDNCGVVSTNQLAGLASGSLFPVGKTTNTFSVVDASGNSNVCSFVVTVTDKEAPTATCPPDISVTNAPGLCGSNVVYSVGGADNCGVVSTNQLAGLASGALFPVGKTTNTFSVVDASGNSNVCSFVVTVTDTEAPAITCPPNIYATNALGLCGSNVVYSVGGTDNCGVVSTNLLAGLASGSLFPVGKTTNTFSVVDASGNSNVCSFTVTVTDTEAPVATCPPDISVTNAAGLCGSNVVYSVGGTDNCGVVSTNQLAGLASGSLFPVGKTTNTFSVVDASGNSNVCSFTVTVTDTQPPVATCPPDINVTNAAGLCGSNVVFNVGGTDNCGVVSTNQLAGLASGDLFPVGKTTNTFSVVDASGNSNVCSFTVTVTDTQPPTITCPPNIYVTNAPGLCGSNVVYSVGGTDNCGVVSTNQLAGLASGDLFPVGKTTNTFSVVDASGNSNVCSFTVTVTDKEAPTIICPPNIYATNAPGLCGSNVVYSVGGTDNCAVVSTNLLAGLASGSLFPVGKTTNTFSVVDASGNSNVCSFTVTVTDKEAPTVTCPPDISVTNAPGLCGSNVVFSVGGSDNCGVVSTNQLAGLASGSLFPVGKTTNTFSVVDASGNSNVCSFTVTVTDKEAPTVTCPPNIYVTNAPGLCGSNVVYSVGGTDNCGVVSTNQLAGLASGALFPVGKTTNRFSVVDASGNSNVCSFTVTVTDTQPPTITCPPNIYVTNALGLCGSNVVYSVGGSDNCGVVSTNQLAGLASGALFPVGKTTNRFSVVDASGNSNVCSFTVTVTDKEAPVVTWPGNVNLSCTNCDLSPTNTGRPTAIDNCATATTNYTDATSGDCPKRVERTWIVTDIHGNSVTNVQVIQCLAGSQVLVTDSSLCTYDIDPSTTCKDFRLLFTQDPQNFPNYKLTASNPGQTYYNLFFKGTPGASVTFTITLPYPYVTQGAQPIHAYDWVDMIPKPGNPSQQCIVPGKGFYVNSTQITLASYGTNAAVGSNTTITVTLTVPATGFIYLNIHLDYGLKKTTGYSRDTADDDALNTGGTKTLIPNHGSYTFSSSTSGGGTSSDSLCNINVFKKLPGVGGMAGTLYTTFDGVSGSAPKKGCTVVLKDPKGVVLTTGVTDDDGWYFCNYKWTGKATTLTITLTPPGGKPQTQSVSLKSNGYAQADFNVP